MGKARTVIRSDGTRWSNLNARGQPRIPGRRKPGSTAGRGTAGKAAAKCRAACLGNSRDEPAAPRPQLRPRRTLATVRTTVYVRTRTLRNSIADRHQDSASAADTEQTGLLLHGPANMTSPQFRAAAGGILARTRTGIEFWGLAAL